MFTVFLFAAVLGGIVFIVQFLLALVGMGGDEFDIADDFPDQVDISDDLFGAGEAIDQGSPSLFGSVEAVAAPKPCTPSELSKVR